MPILYVIVVFGVAVKVIVAPVPEQIVVDPLMLAVGFGRTVSTHASVTIGHVPSPLAVTVKTIEPPPDKDPGIV